MKKNLNTNFIQTVLRASVCLFVLSGSNTLVAQEEAQTDSTTNTVIRPAKKAPQYKMKEITGKIYDAATRTPMGGVRIQALNNNLYSSLTEEDGSYKINVPVFVHALYVYAPDYTPLQVAIKGSSEQNAFLHTGNFKTFYKDGTEITAKTEAIIENSSSLSIEGDIQNQLAGEVYSINRTGTPAQGAYMLIRGIHSLNANTQPLIIIDGVMMDMQENRTSLHEGFFNNILAGFDPEEIESVEVCKNATALYGAKGANGVLLIKTKRGKSMATKINVRIFGGFELAPKYMDMMSGSQFKNYMSDMIGTTAFIENRPIGGSSLITTALPFLNEDKDYYWYPMYHNNTDWSKDLYQTAFAQNYKVSVEGGDEVAMYNLSLGYTSSESTAKGTDFSRLNLRFNADIKITDNLHTAMDIAYNRMTYNILDNGWSESYEIQNIASPNVLGLAQTPFLSKYSYYTGPDGKLHQSTVYAGKYAADVSLYDYPNLKNPFNYATPLSDDNTVMSNPYWIIANGEGVNKNYSELTQFNINVMPKWQITKQLYVSNRLNYALNRNSEKYYMPKNGTSKYELEGLGFVTSVLKSQFSKETTLNNDFRIDWKNNYGAHDIHAFGGWRYNNYSYSYTYLRGYNNDNDKMPNMSYSRQYKHYTGTNDNWIDMAYYANADYSFRNKYFAQATVSMQASSRFGKETESGFQMGGVSWGVFPSLQLGWLISSESWFKGAKGVDYLKMTAGIDQSGNDNIDYYASRTYWESSRYLDNAIGLVLANIENPKIQWETTTTYNLGLEGSFINNRLTAGINVYWSKTDDLLVRKDVSFLTGLDKYWTNDGSMENRGFEFNTNAILINKRNWKWQMGASIGHYNNEITKLPSSDVIRLVDANGKLRQTINGYTSSIYGKDNILTAVGHSAGVFYGYKTQGVFATDADARCNNGDYLKYPTGNVNDPYKNFKAGDIHFTDINGDGVISDADKTVIGNPNPDIYGNIFTSLSYKRLRLDMTFKYSLGNDVYNYQRSQLESASNFYNQTTAIVNRWSYEGHVTDIPRLCATDSKYWVNNERFSERWIEDGSYLKLKNIRLTYVVPVSTSWLQGIKVWGEANDVFTLTKYLGIDPETSSRNNVLYQGIDTGLLSLGRSFNIGVTINL